MVTDSGMTAVGPSIDPPELQELDQSGELMHALRWYTDLSGDHTLIQTYRTRLPALLEHCLKSRDATGLIHNKREFWEQTMDDAYEIAYNSYAITSLRDAAALAKDLGAEDRKERWLQDADAMQKAMMTVLVDKGAFTKRRNVDGKIAEHLCGDQAEPDAFDVPSHCAVHNQIYPDASMALPMALGLVKSDSPLAINTLNEIEKLRNQRWWGGGYDRYDSTSEINDPGPWGIAGALVLRGQHAGGMLDRSRSTLEWFRTVPGGNSGLYLEEIPLFHNEQVKEGIVTWPTGELPYFTIHYWLGVSFEDNAVVIHPKLYPEQPAGSGRSEIPKGPVAYRDDGSGPVASATLDGRPVQVGADGGVRLPGDFAGGSLVLRTKK